MSDLVPYDYQVAGHHKGSQSRVLKDGKGRILKPLKVNANPTFNPDAKITPRDAPSEQELVPVCRDELEFYQRVVNSTHQDDASLRPFMPSFHGSHTITGPDGYEAVHLILGDLTWGMRHPCVADIKIGHTDYYPGKSVRKRAIPQELGFRLTGMRVVQVDDGSLVTRLSQEDCKKLSASQVLRGLDKFCCSDTHVASCLRHSIVSQLNLIHHWFVSQCSYKIRGSSILIVYDAEQFASVTPDAMNGKSVKAGEVWPKVIVKMIDFAHVLHSFGDKDENYISGLENLMKYIKNKENEKL